MATAIKRLLVGRALRTEQAAHELAVAAAATNGASFGYVVPVSVGIAVLLAIVATSYRQTIHAYPSGAALTSSRKKISAKRLA